jgi:hypothetical protein
VQKPDLFKSEHFYQFVTGWNITPGRSYLNKDCLPETRRSRDVGKRVSYFSTHEKELRTPNYKGRPSPPQLLGNGEAYHILDFSIGQHEE